MIFCHKTRGKMSINNADPALFLQTINIFRTSQSVKFMDVRPVRRTKPKRDIFLVFFAIRHVWIHLDRIDIAKSQIAEERGRPSGRRRKANSDGHVTRREEGGQKPKWF